MVLVVDRRSSGRTLVGRIAVDCTLAQGVVGPVCCSPAEILEGRNLPALATGSPELAVVAVDSRAVMNLDMVGHRQALVVRR